MCGIVGFTYQGEWKHREPPGHILRGMLSLMTHRGPDDQGTHEVRGLAMGMRRLSIIDLEGGHQPQYDETGNIAVIFNGEIYNYLEIRESLKGKYRFRTNSDTEVIVHLYKERGEDFVNELHGMFAIAIHDKARNRLLLCRDRFGIKPLYYARLGEVFLFSSEIRPLLRFPGFPRRLNLPMVDQYLKFQYVPGPGTLFENILRLDPGKLLILENGSERIRRYYCVQPLTDIPRDPEDQRHELRSRIEQSVKWHLRSDVPVGIFLSGGVDSTVLTSLCARYSSTPVHTFTIGYKDGGPLFDETVPSRETARYFGTDHKEIIVDPDIVDTLEKVIRHLEDPSADSSILVSHIISRETSQCVKVALTGIGGDELFGGYPRYFSMVYSPLYTRIPAWLRHRIIHPAIYACKSNRSNRFSNFIRRFRRMHEAAGLGDATKYDRYTTLYTPEDKAALYTDYFKEKLEGVECLPTTRLKGSEGDAGPADLLNRVLMHDIQTYLPDNLLSFCDKLSMAHSLEVRVPFLDHRVVEYAMSLPGGSKIKGLRSKVILKDAFREGIPRHFLRRKKIGFMAPIEQWLRKDLKGLVKDCLAAEVCERRGLFNAEVIEKMIRDHDNQLEDHSQKIFALVVLEMWMREFMDKPSI